MSNYYERSVYTHYAKKEEPTPKYHCSTCTKCEGKYCKVFNRYVEKNYNKCFLHSNYTPIVAKFEPTVTMEEIAEAEKRRYA